MTGPEVLPGGASNHGAVVRIGDQVRRPLRPHSPAVHRLLRHLAAVGFDGAPRLVGSDGTYEYLSYVPGQVPLPPWVFETEVLAAVGRLVRRFHDATAGFAVRPDDGWEQLAPQRWAGDQLGHGDLVRSNVVFQDRRPVALIDFDLVAPFSPVWEIGCAVRHWIPLRGEGPEGPDAAPAVTAAKLRAFCLAYGLPAAERARVLDAVLDAEDLQLALLRRWVEEGSEVYRQIWAAGAPERIGQRIGWITRHRSTLAAALA